MPNNIIDRETYRSIKKMSRQELNAFLLRYAENLQNSSPELDLREMEKDILSIKGIGEKRADEVIKVVERHLRLDK